MVLDPHLKSNRRAWKIEQIVRLEIGGFSDEEISLSIGCHKVYVSMLRRTPDYIRVRNNVLSNVISDYDIPLQEQSKVVREQLQQLVPVAVGVLKQKLFDGSNPKLQFEAAKELLDREGTHVKVSKSEIKHKEEFNFNMHESVKEDILAALQNPNAQEIEESASLFTQTISAEEQIEISKAMPLEKIASITDTIQ